MHLATSALLHLLLHLHPQVVVGARKSQASKEWDRKRRVTWGDQGSSKAKRSKSSYRSGGLNRSRISFEL